MGSREMKNIFKEIREAIKFQRYAEAIQKCRDVLHNDPNNYMAFVLMGATYQNIDKSEAAKFLRKAVSYSPGQPTVALQGLANCAPVEELPEIFEDLLNLVPEKRLEYINKLYLISSTQSASNGCFRVLKKIALEYKNPNEMPIVFKYLANVWVKHGFEVEENEEYLLKTALEEVLKISPPVEDDIGIRMRYLKLLYKQKNLSCCLKNACHFVSHFPKEIYAYEWICKIYCENYFNEDKECLKELILPVEEYTQALRELKQNSGLAMLVEAIDLVNKQEFIQARQLLYEVQKVQPNYYVTVKLLVRVEMEIGAYSLAIPLCAQSEDLQKEYAICLSYEDENEKLEKSANLLNKMKKTEEMFDALGRCYFKLKEKYLLRQLEPKLSPTCKAEFTMTINDALDFLKTQQANDMFPILMLQGQLYYKLKRFGEALNSILLATRLRSYHSECFYHLGLIYYAIKDVTRARKCLEKCINLNRVNEDAVHTLSAIYHQTDMEDLNEVLLLNCLKHLKTTKTKRIHYKLGLHYLHIHKWDDAIQSFRSAIKLDATCAMYWESLGDAYAGRGSYMSAIRVYQKLLEMDPENIYAKLQAALIKTTVRMYPEAIEDFDKLLETKPDYLPALKGAADAHIGLAKCLKQEHRYVRAKNHLQFAVDHLQRVFLVQENISMVWIWRSTANVFILTAQMPTSLAYLEVSGKLCKNDEEKTFLPRKDLFLLAIRFYTSALKLKQNTYLWYELAYCAYHTAIYFPDEAKTYLELATKACRIAIQQQCNRWQNWNLLGVINMHESVQNLPLSQHCFIQALTFDRKSFVTWANLGVLYTNLNQAILANQAFQRAQQANPVYLQAWVGQALIAEAMDEEEESLDLFRHCQQFEYNSEAALGYAHWVTDFLKNAEKANQKQYKRAIEGMNAEIVALDAIHFYVINEEERASVEGLSFLAYLLTRQKMYRPAVKAYKSAIAKLDTCEARNQLLTNLGFLYLKLNEPNEAIEVFHMLSEAHFKALVGLARAYFLAGQFQEAYSVYNQVLSTVASNEHLAANILVAMAAMVYDSQGVSDTQTIIYQCILLKDYPIQAVYSACALGILHNIDELTKIMLVELKRQENKIEHVAHVAYLTSQYYLVSQKEPRKALTYILGRVHVCPHSPELRKILAEFLLSNCEHDPTKYVATSQTAKAAINLVHQNKSKKSDCIEDSNLLLIASRAMRPFNKTRSLKLIERAMHMYPQNELAWASLNELKD